MYFQLERYKSREVVWWLIFKLPARAKVTCEKGGRVVFYSHIQQVLLVSFSYRLEFTGSFRQLHETSITCATKFRSLLPARGIYQTLCRIPRTLPKIAIRALRKLWELMGVGGRLRYIIRFAWL